MGRAKLNVRKHSLRLFEGDFEEMADLYPQLGGTIAIRNLIHKHIEQMKEIRQRQLSAMPSLDLDIDE